MTPILYVTGDEPHATSVTTKLKHQPAYEVRAVSTAAEATELLSKKSEIQCLLLPETLPNTDVFEFIESLTQSYPELAVVLYPTDSSEAIAKKAITANVTEYISYSEAAGHIDDLVATIQDAIEQQWPIASLHERIKELHGIRTVARLLEDPTSRAVRDILEDVATELPQAFQYPDAAEVRLTVGSTTVQTPHFQEREKMLSVAADTATGTQIRLDVVYTEPKPIADYGPFLSEEESFCVTIVTLLKGGIERRTYVDELEKSEVLFRELAENLTEVLWVSDAKTETMHYVNPEYEKVWGRSRDSLYADPLSFIDSVHKADQPRVRETVKNKAKGHYDIEYRIVHQDGSIRWIHDRGIPVFDADGNPYRFVGLAEEITNRKKRGQQLAVLNRVLRHNLRNDLNIMMGYADLIISKTDGEPAAHAETIIDVGHKVMTLTEKQQKIAAQINTNHEAVTFDLKQMLTEVKDDIQEIYTTATITITAPDDLSITVTPELEHAVFELVTNAIKHTSAQATVELAGTHTDDTVTIAVSDQGTGIPEDEIAVLGQTEEQLFHGSGSGLWLVHWVVTNAGGTLHVERNEPQGTIVRIQLPNQTVAQP
ncbi:PAS domain-containing protein [Natronocalculus amylovorans]|uniref:histidine kinase n=1 Tax=Natronocalculus amylovorans TaxID=2917812 RepID=A0AAE3FYX9_9EURY|nr:PAS domain-containing protein [Natronocalculus amylovorans]MCL9817445.1 PAS domain-containing protein [Natronocalculus amylovorans]